ncbi:MAG: serine/threonine protein kinase [Verrucomicrobia bacterium]|nr:serine/threonine protein kinase [Verrucomicrobiota bacterium]
MSSSPDQTLSESAVATALRPVDFSSPTDAGSAAVSFQHFAIARREDGSLHELGRGAMGVTYKAFDTQLGSHVALKVISPHYLHDGAARERFLREARAAAHLNHPNVASVFHLGSDNDTVFYAMQFVEGETVESFVKRRGPLPPRQALQIILQAAQGLAAANDRGLIHRDIKPANLMLAHARTAADGIEEEEDELHVKVIDFGLAKSLVKDDKAATEADDNAAPRLAASLTGGGPVGTPYFMSPEQIDPAGAAALDARTDIYSLGVTLWYLLVGKPPFQGTQFQVFSQHMSKPPPLERLTEAGIAPGIVSLVDSMLAKEPEDRPASYRVLTGALKRLLREAESPGARETVSSAGTFSFESKTASASAVPTASFALVEILRRRGALPPREAFLLLRPVAGLVDGVAAAAASLPAALTTENLRVEFAEPPANLRDLPARAVDVWPAFTVRFAAATAVGENSANAASAAVDLDRTLLPAAAHLARGGMRAHPLRQLGALAYELLNGAPPGPLGFVPISALSEQGNYLLRECLHGGSKAARAFPSAAVFIAALSEATTRSGASTLIEAPLPKMLLTPLTPKPPGEESLPYFVPAEPASSSSSAALSICAFLLFLGLAIGGYVWRKPIADYLNEKRAAANSPRATAAPSVVAAAPTPTPAARNVVAAATPTPRAIATPTPASVASINAAPRSQQLSSQPTPLPFYLQPPQPQPPPQQQTPPPLPPMNAGGMPMMFPPPPPPPPPPDGGGRPGGGPPRR